MHDIHQFSTYNQLIKLTLTITLSVPEITKMKVELEARIFINGKDTKDLALV